MNNPEIILIIPTKSGKKSQFFKMFFVKSFFPKKSEHSLNFVSILSYEFQDLNLHFIRKYQFLRKKSIETGYTHIYIYIKFSKSQIHVGRMNILSLALGSFNQK